MRHWSSYDQFPNCHVWVHRSGYWHQSTTKSRPPPPCCRSCWFLLLFFSFPITGIIFWQHWCLGGVRLGDHERRQRRTKAPLTLMYRTIMLQCAACVRPLIHQLIIDLISHRFTLLPPPPHSDRLLADYSIIDWLTAVISFQWVWMRFYDASFNIQPRPFLLLLPPPPVHGNN